MNFFLPPSFRDRETKKPSSSEKAFWSEPTSAAPPLSFLPHHHPCCCGGGGGFETGGGGGKLSPTFNCFGETSGGSALRRSPEGLFRTFPFSPVFLFSAQEQKKRWRKSKSYFRFWCGQKYEKRRIGAAIGQCRKRGSGKKTRMSVQKYVGNDISEGGDEGLLLCLFGTPEGGQGTEGKKRKLKTGEF